ncbi:MAG: flagellar biosynthetic protein FliQ [Phycisphaerales bacterium]
MTEADMVDALRSALSAALVLALPLLVVGLLVGLISGLIQSLSNVQDAAAAFAPRLIAVALVAIALAGWMSSKVVDFAVMMMGCVLDLSLLIVIGGR